jgi:hypothetical protein
MGDRERTFVGWISASGQVMVGMADARSGILQDEAIGQLPADDHGSPAILVEPDRRLTVFWSGHNGPGMYYRSTRRPEDIDSWGATHTVRSGLSGGQGFTYPNPVMLAREHHRLYLFWRGADWSATYATRSLGGSWSAARKLILQPGQRPYVKVDSDGRRTIAIAFTNGHPRERVTSVYYMGYRRGSLWHASGRRIASLDAGPVVPSQADVVYDGRRRGISGWLWDVAIGSRRHPVVLYATFPAPNHHQYWYARWNGRRWVSHFLTDAGPSISPGTIEQQYSGGMSLDHNDPSTVLLSRKFSGHFRIERWHTPDGGGSWQRRTLIAEGHDAVRPVVPRGPRGGAVPLLWLQGHYGSYKDYHTSIALRWFVKARPGVTAPTLRSR